MKKKILSVLLSVLLLAVPAAVLADGVTDAPTPALTARLRFVKKLGTGYRFAPTPPVYVDGAILTVSGVKLYKLDAETGEELASVKLESRTMYTVVPPAVADGVIYVPLDDGILQAIDFETLTPLWIYRDPLLGQALTVPVCADGDLYCAFWNGETADANYFCLHTEDEDPARPDEEKTAVWTHTAPGGFYKASAAVYGDWLIFGGEDGARGDDGESHVTALDRRTGAAVSALATQGDLRSETVYDPATDRFYVCSKAGLLYAFACDKQTGALEMKNTYRASGGMTAAPVIFNGRLYTGCQDGTAGKFLVLDAATLTEIYAAPTPGYPQARMLVTTAYTEPAGTVFVYTTYNRKPGGLLRFSDTPGQTEASGTELFVPDEDAAQYCICPPEAGPDGTVYYKNDSGNLFAVCSDGAEAELLRGGIRRLREWIAALFRILKEWFSHANGR